MIFNTLQGITIPEGVVSEIKNANGVILWTGSKPTVLQVEKITADTYANETTYTGEQFILLNIYPKAAGSVVEVTYGGLTKTLTAEGTNFMRVIFGTLYGVTDSVSTPASGQLTIKGDFTHFGVGEFSVAKLTSATCLCIKGIVKYGAITHATWGMYNGWYTGSTLELPEGITHIAEKGFSAVDGIPTEITLPSTIVEIGASAFSKSAGKYTYGSSSSTFNAYNPTINRIVLKSITPPTIPGSDRFDTALPFGNPGRPNANATGLIEYPSGFRIIVPKGCFSAYQSKVIWRAYIEYANYIEEEA